MTAREYRYFILSDLYRYTGEVSWSRLLRELVLGETYKYTFWMRTCCFAHRRGLLRVVLWPLAYLILRRYRYRFGISIPYRTRIGPGFYIGHFGSVVVNEATRIGANCNISQGSTLGKSNRGPRKGYPTLGDNVYVGPGAKVIGSLTIGNNVAVGANAVVTKDVPDNAVVVGVPARVLSHDGAKGYVSHTDYALQLGPFPGVTGRRVRNSGGG